MAFWTRKRKKAYVPPPPPPEVVERVHEAEITAEHQLSEALSRQPDVDERRDRMLKIERENALGPRFWAAVGQTRRT